MNAVLDTFSNRVVRDEEGNLVASEDLNAMLAICNILNQGETPNDNGEPRYRVKENVNL